MKLGFHRLLPNRSLPVIAASTPTAPGSRRGGPHRRPFRNRRRSRLDPDLDHPGRHRGRCDGFVPHPVQGPARGARDDGGRIEVDVRGTRNCSPTAGTATPWKPMIVTHTRRHSGSAVTMKEAVQSRLDKLVNDCLSRRLICCKEGRTQRNHADDHRHR
jgi:hypothetical protein